MPRAGQEAGPGGVSVADRGEGLWAWPTEGGAAPTHLAREVGPGLPASGRVGGAEPLSPSSAAVSRGPVTAGGWFRGTLSMMFGIAGLWVPVFTGPLPWAKSLHLSEPQLPPLKNAGDSTTHLMGL